MLFYFLVFSSLQLKDLRLFNNHEQPTPNEIPDPKPIEIPIAILSRAIPKVIATPTPMTKP